MATITVLDNMEYGSEAAAQAGYVSNAIYGGIDEYTTLYIKPVGVDGGTSFTDLSSYEYTINRGGNAQIDTDRRPFTGIDSILFDGNGDYLGLGNQSNHNFPGDFTIEAWVYCSYASSDLQMICAKQNSGAALYLDTSRRLCFAADNVAQKVNSTGSISLNTWTHVAVVRSGTSLKLYIDGTNDGSVTDSTNYTTTGNLYIGSSADTLKFYWYGSISNLRFSKEIARWTSNFTPTQSAYNNSAYVQPYSEASILVEGSYSLKAVATQTTSLNKTLTRTISSPINLTGHAYIIGKIRASRTGSNIKIGFHDSGGTTTEVTPNITSADTWQTIQFDISGVSDSNKDAIDQIIITITNADYDTTFYLDMIWAISGISEPLFNDAIPQRVFIPFRGTSRFLNYSI